MRLVKDWKQAHRWYSTQALAATATVVLVWQAIPDDLRATAPPWLTTSLLLFLVIGGLVGRLVEQTPNADADKH